MSEGSSDLRFAVIGCGGMGTNIHTPNMAMIDGAATVAYCDMDESRAENLLATYGGRVHDHGCQQGVRR